MSGKAMVNRMRIIERFKGFGKAVVNRMRIIERFKGFDNTMVI